MPEKMNRFLMKTREDGDLNQYWYSERSIAAIQREVEEQASKACFLSTPSIYFSLKKVRVCARGRAAVRPSAEPDTACLIPPPVLPVPPLRTPEYPPPDGKDPRGVRRGLR